MDFPAGRLLAGVATVAIFCSSDDSGRSLLSEGSPSFASGQILARPASSRGIVTISSRCFRSPPYTV